MMLDFSLRLIGFVAAHVAIGICLVKAFGG